MELLEAVRNRRSIRSFLKKPVSEEIIKELLAESLWAPSWGNTQPWEIVVVTGSALERFEEENTEALMSGKTSKPDVPMPDEWYDSLKKRYTDLGKDLLGSLSIPRGDEEGRLQYYKDMFSLFDAPALILMVIDSRLSLEYAILDAGLFLQNFYLLAHGRGLGTIPLAVSVHYPEIAHELFSIPDTKRIILGSALGWPEPNAPVNNFERTRGEIEEFVRFVK